jgi:cellulose synthase/poly-beta-1,6-N-acetylglucosamine synthase-like glycosyltransferase
MHAGWRGEQSTEVTINQQGLNSLRALMRQRTRWSQGTWQVFDLIRPSLRNRGLPFSAKLDQFWYLLTPLVQAWLGMVLVMSLAFLALRVVEPRWSILFAIILYMFAAMPSMVGVLFTRRRRGLKGFLVNVLFAHVYLMYSWIIYPVVYRALFRQLTGARTWAKTAREQIAPDEEATDAPAAPGTPGEIEPPHPTINIPAPNASKETRTLP